MVNNYTFEPKAYKTEVESLQLDKLYNLLLSKREIVFIIDSLIKDKYPDLLNSLNSKITYIFTAKESNKNLKNVEQIYEFLTKINVKRSTIICGIGGGITTDITAFAASTFKRGCRLWLIPTTVIAMVDAAIGGKTAVNNLNVKNAIGTFYPAEKVFYCSDFLRTLPLTEGLNGLYEIQKISFINQSFHLDKSVFSRGITQDLILQAAELKFDICHRDLYDKGERRKLNLGHSFAHLIEVLTEYKVPHGLAVGIGMRIALNLSLRLGIIDTKTNLRIESQLNQIPLTVFLDSNLIVKIKELGKEILLSDKKATDTLNLILFKGAEAEVTVYPISFSELIINSIIEEIEKLC